MRNVIIGMLVAVGGVMIARAGQGIMTTMWDGLWAGVAVASVLSGITIATYASLRRRLMPATARTTPTA